MAHITTLTIGKTEFNLAFSGQDRKVFLLYGKSVPMSIVAENLKQKVAKQKNLYKYGRAVQLKLSFSSLSKCVCKHAYHVFKERGGANV